MKKLKYNSILFIVALLPAILCAEISISKNAEYTSLRKDGTVKTNSVSDPGEVMVISKKIEKLSQVELIKKQGEALAFIIEDLEKLEKKLEEKTSIKADGYSSDKLYFAGKKIFFKIATSGANIRSAPNLQAKIIRQLVKGDYVLVEDIAGDWCKLAGRGYVHRSIVLPVSLEDISYETKD